MQRRMSGILRKEWCEEMLDYEVYCYEVSYVEKGAFCWFTRDFDTEEELVSFVKSERKNWEVYRIQKVLSAIVDF